MNNIRSITKREFITIRKELDHQVRRCVNYMRKVNNDRIICTAEYYMLTADDNLIIYIRDDYSEAVSDAQHTKFRKLLVDNVPSTFVMDDGIVLTVEVIMSLSVYNNDRLLHILANSFEVVIPTSSRHGLNIIDRYNPEYESLISYMDETAVWWLRDNDGPPVETDEDDCYIYEYVANISKYI